MKHGVPSVRATLPLDSEERGSRRVRRAELDVSELRASPLRESRARGIGTTRRVRVRKSVGPSVDFRGSIERHRPRERLPDTCCLVSPGSRFFTACHVAKSCAREA